MKLANLQLHLLLSTDCELAFSFLTFKHRCCHRTTGRNNVAVFVLSFDYGSMRQVYIQEGMLVFISRTCLYMHIPSVDY